MTRVTNERLEEIKTRCERDNCVGAGVRLAQDCLALIADRADDKAEIERLKQELHSTGSCNDWREREAETQEALQKIGDEFGVHGGEPRVDGLRRVLTEQRDRIASLEAERDELRKKAGAMKGAIQGLLRHACIADAAPEDVDEEDRLAERVARSILAAADEREKK